MKVFLKKKKTSYLKPGKISFMKKLFLFTKLVVILNSIFAVLLLFSYALPYIFPRSFPALSVLSLSVPILIFINILFFIYWIIRLKKYFLISLVVLLFGHKHISSLFKFSGKDENSPTAFKVMSYNVRVFNLYKWIDREGVDSEIIKLIKEESPDIVCLQEFYSKKEREFKYPYAYFKYKGTTGNIGQAILSKYPIIKKGSLEFAHSGNNAIFADIVKDKDTIRVYNLHLQSFHIDPQQEELTQENSERLYERMGSAFVVQQEQAEVLENHRRLCSYKKIVCGDFNNTQYSNVYHQIKDDLKDTFDEAGGGFGRSYHYKYFPLRIDFILVDEDMEVLSHRNLTDQALSDHYPIVSSLKLD